LWTGKPALSQQLIKLIIQNSLKSFPAVRRRNWLRLTGD
jgi:hypothetical protein